MQRLLLVGTGTTRVARMIHAAEPPMLETTAIESAWIYTGARMPPRLHPLAAPPFRAPHHTVSIAGLIGTNGRPGEVHLAHGGVLFLDELDEFRTDAIRALACALNLGSVAGIPCRPVMVIGAVRDWGPYASVNARVLGMISNG